MVRQKGYDKVENEDGTVTYTFHLRDGIKWSDGKMLQQEISNTLGNVL